MRNNTKREALQERAKKLEDDAIKIAEQQFTRGTLAVVKHAAVAHAELKLKAATLLWKRAEAFR